MSLERLEAAIERFVIEVASAKPEHPSNTWQLDRSVTLQLLESMLLARHLDLLAHHLRREGKGHYTICSAGHEANVVLGRLSKVSDPTIVHYRSAALQIERARQVPTVNTVRDIALGLVAAASDPLCAGRHKAFGSKVLGIIPQTSTIASQLPRAVGLAFALERMRRLALPAPPPADAIAIVSFGDASLNHSTAQGALNAAGWVVHQNLKLPLLLVCEDNQLGISVRTPPDWTRTRLTSQPHLTYFHAEAWHLDRTFEAARAAIAHCRERRLPAVLHLECERLLGHAGSDVDTKYRSRDEIERAEMHDPVLRAALSAIRAGVLGSEEVSSLNRAAAARVAEAGAFARSAEGLATRQQVAAPLTVPATPPAPPPERAATARGTLAQGINQALLDLLGGHREALVFGEDVARKGGVYGVTKGLLEAAGPARVFNTLLDEQTILGLALGTATLGMLPVPEIQYLAYLHNAEDQLRGEAATLRYFSNNAYDNPMILRIAGLAYQKGFGGHFHNDNSLAVLRDIPSLIVGVPSRADDALGMYRTAEHLTLTERQVVVFVEPIALYHERHLHDEADEGWLASLAPASAALGEVRVYAPEARDLLLISYGNGLRLSLRAARTLERQAGVHVRVLDLRWLKPLPFDAVKQHVRDVPRAIIVDECRATGSVSEELLARLAEEGLGHGVRRVTSADSLIPLGDAAKLVLVSEAEIVALARTLIDAATAATADTAGAAGTSA